MKEKKKWYHNGGPWPQFYLYLVVFVSGMAYGSFLVE
jgi:hypothetical protein